jgi:hypothetical protein
MGLNFAVDELYATGWSTLDSSGCEFLEGRQYPGVHRVQREFAGQGFSLSIRRVELFDCFRAEWRISNGDAGGAIVAQSETEAAVYALAQLRRQAASTSTQPSA